MFGEKCTFRAGLEDSESPIIWAGRGCTTIIIWNVFGEKCTFRASSEDRTPIIWTGKVCPTI